MTLGFSDIPEVVIDYVRNVFGAANDKVSRVMDVHPSMHEEFLDQTLITELSAAPPAFFAAERIGVSIESHWLGGRWMWHRWEIADIAFFIVIRSAGQLQQRKVVLLQTKRLYSKEIAVHELERADFEIGIGRIADRTDPQLPLSTPRRFTFDDDSVYGAIRAGHHQIEDIDHYSSDRGIPVYYGLYNPTTLPWSSDYPAPAGSAPTVVNAIGCRVLPSDIVHGVVSALPDGRSPSIKSLTTTTPLDAADASSTRGWRLERFVADEVLRCRQGRLFEDHTDPNLSGLLYERSAPIQAAITITIDVAGGER